VKIRIIRSGGYAGIEENFGSIDTVNLSKEAASRVAKYVSTLNQLKHTATEYEPIGTDMFHYKIEIQNDRGESQRLVISDDGDPQNPFMKALRDLTDALGVPL
jgi:hypothetical protein